MGFTTLHQRSFLQRLAIRLLFASVLAALLFGTITTGAHADGTQPVSFSDGKLYLAKHMDHFVTDAALPDADIVSGNYDSQFATPSNAYLAQDKDNWYRFTIKNEGNHTGEWILALDSAMVDDAELIYLQDGTVYKQQTGLRHPYTSRPVPYNMFAFPIQQAAGVTETYYLKIKTPFQIYFSPTITDYPTFLKDVAVNFSFPHLFIGLLMGVFVYLLVLSFGTVTELTVHRFVWFVFFAVLIIMYVDGFLMAYLPNNEWLATRLWLFLHIGLQISYLRATQGFFRTKENYPYINIYLNICIVSAIVLLLLLFLMPYSLLVRFELWNAAQMILIMTALSIYIWACERRKVTLFVVGNIGMLVMAAISTFAALSSLTASDWLVKHGFELGFCWQAIFFTWALSQKINELATATIAAKADSTAKSEFIAKMSHEIRTPMNGVLGMTQLLRTTPINNEQKHYLNVIESSGKTLLAVINDILDYSKLMAGKTELVPSHFNLEQMLAELNTLFGDIAHSKNISFNIIITPGTPVNLYGDDVRLRQVLTNLLSNAFKFTDRGLVILKVKSSSPHSEKNVTLRFSVQDTGIGVNPADQKNLFKNFTQVESHAARRYGGTGLGLSICKQFVEMMGGDISVNSGAGAGAEFIFTVHMQISSAIEPTPNLDSKLITEGSVQRLKILVAEDDAINRDVLSGFLKKAAWDADFVFNGKEAVDKIENGDGHYNLVLMDCEMPIIDGITACKSIRKIEKKSGGKPIPIVALTAHTSTAYLKRCTDAGMTECLCKPISYDQLHNIIVRLTS